MKAKIVLLNAALAAVTVVSTHFITISSAQQGTAPAKPAANVEYQLGGTLYMQKAAEYRALAYQAYNIARWRLDADMDKKNVKKLPKAERKKPRAIMVDIDETVLDNSPAQAFNIVNHLPFDLNQWYRWGEMRKAKPIPGAVEFLNYATSKGVKIFYVSNRDREPQLRATIDNLKSAGFHDISTENVMLREKGPDGKLISAKDPRRDIIRKKYRIVFFIGDNLDDHSSAFEHRSIAERFAEVDKAKGLFGKRYIMLPNAMYGTWENAIYGYNGKLTEAEKEQMRLNALELP